jgi:hypothetical protein
MAVPFIFPNFTLHTLIHTFAFWNETQYLGLSLENAESLAPLFYFSASCTNVNSSKV